MTTFEFDPSYDANKYFALKYGIKTFYCEFVSGCKYSLEKYVSLHRFQLGFTDPLDFNKLKYVHSGEYVPGETIVQRGQSYIIVNHTDTKGFGSRRPQPKNVYVINNVLCVDETGLVVIVAREKDWANRARALYTEAILPLCCNSVNTDIDEVCKQAKRLLVEFDAAIAGNHYTVIPTSPETPEAVVSYVHG